MLKLAENECLALGKYIRGSAQKLNLVAQMIRGKPVADALNELTFSKRRMADDVKKVLQAAIANAENNRNLDIDSLVVSKAWVGKQIMMKRFRARAKGRGARILKPFSTVTIIVQEKKE